MAGAGPAARGSVTAAEQVPGLLGAARAAYTAALNTTAGATAVVFLALAVLSAVTLQHVPPLRSYASAHCFGDELLLAGQFALADLQGVLREAVRRLGDDLQ